MILRKSKILSLLFLISSTILANDSKKGGLSSLPLANEAIAGACLGAVQAIAAPLKDVAQAVVSPFLHPVETFNYLRLTLFTINNSRALTFTKLVNLQQIINNVINNLIIDPANSSNKLLRKQIINDVQGAVAADEKEFLFGITNCIDHLNNFKDILISSVPVYEHEIRRKAYSLKSSVYVGVTSGSAIGAVAFYKELNRNNIAVSTLAGATLGFLGDKVIQSPYSKEDLEQIIFLTKQVVKHCEFMIMLLSGLKGLSDITDKKDAVGMLLKNLTAEIAHLAFIVEPTMAFDPRYKGLKVIYDAAKLTDKAATKNTAA